MFRVSDNAEIYTNTINATAIALKRGSGEIFSFQYDRSGASLLSKLKSGAGRVHAAELNAEERDALEGLLELEIMTDKPESDLRNPFRSQWQWFHESKADPVESQSKIQNSKIGIIGLGATGAWIALQLAMIGFRKFVLMDPDRVEVSNLVRQPFWPGQIGRFKTEAIQEVLRTFRSDLEFSSSQVLVEKGEEIFPAFEDCDLVLIAADHPSRHVAGSVIGRACWKRGVAHVVCGGYSGHGGSLGVTLIPGKTPCWDCYQAEVRRKTAEIYDARDLIAKGPLNPAGFLPTVLFSAAATAHEVTRILIGLEPQAAGIHRDLWTDRWRFTETRFARAPGCPTCGELARRE
jgi:bacteriocin biosynthesis cyclodehydratase domain-containing protein